MNELTSFRSRKRRKSQTEGQSVPEAPVVKPAGRPSSSSSSTLSHPINPSISSEAYTLAQNALEAANQVGNYTYESIPALIRGAVLAHLDGMALTKASRPGPKRRVTVLLTEEDYRKYDDRFSGIRKRGALLERILLTFLGKGLSG